MALLKDLAVMSRERQDGFAQIAAQFFGLQLADQFLRQSWPLCFQQCRSHVLCG
jgi:hypothetical protein